MVMVFVVSFVLFVHFFNYKGLILPYYKVNRHYFLAHPRVHHTIFDNGEAWPWFVVHPLH
jgi:hypothetical protein